MNQNTRRLTYTALFTAFIFITTSVIKIPIPFTNGYIHAGDMSIFVGSIFLGPFYGAFAAGVGSALADFFGGYAQWVLPTLLVKGIMGFIVGFVAYKHKKWQIGASAFTILWVVGIAFSHQYLSALDPNIIKMQVDEAATVADAVNMTNNLFIQLRNIGIAVPVVASIMLVISKKFSINGANIIGMMLGGIWMVVGYYFAAGIMYGSMIAPFYSIPWNIAQFFGGGILAFIILHALKPTGILEQVKATFE